MKMLWASSSWGMIWMQHSPGASARTSLDGIPREEGRGESVEPSSCSLFSCAAPAWIVFFHTMLATCNPNTTSFHRRSRSLMRVVHALDVCERCVASHNM
ncbi:hypothetical protein OF83DRAFT_1148896 [Amylostereum chailletii]|nr:hypothetical protein OF83DRAFT_1148896 [Amylostereum chailletii]